MIEKDVTGAPRSLRESLPRDSANHRRGREHRKQVRPSTYQARICRYLLLHANRLRRL